MLKIFSIYLKSFYKKEKQKKSNQRKKKFLKSLKEDLLHFFPEMFINNIKKLFGTRNVPI